MENCGIRQNGYSCPHTAMATVLAFLFLLFFSFTLSAREPVLDEKPITLATRHDLPPYVMGDATHGIEIDLVKAIFAQTDFTIQFIQMPRVRMIQMFDDGRINGILTQNASASTEGCITDWYLSHQNRAFSVKSKALEVDGLDSLANYSVLSFDGARRYLGPLFADAVKTNPRYTETPDQSKHVELLYKNRFDLIVGEEWILRLGQQQTYMRTGIYHELEPHDILPISLYAARFQDAAHCTAFNKALHDLRESGEYQNILDQYYEKLQAR